jgi:hypothetical protein
MRRVVEPWKGIFYVMFNDKKCRISFLGSGPVFWCYVFRLPMYILSTYFSDLCINAFNNCWSNKQGCKMEYFLKSQFLYILDGFWVDNFAIFYGLWACFINMYLFMVDGHLVDFVVFWCIFPNFRMLCQEKSGKPLLYGRILNWVNETVLKINVCMYFKINVCMYFKINVCMYFKRARALIYTRESRADELNGSEKAIE